MSEKPAPSAAAHAPDGFLFSPSSRYPTPAAFLVDGDGGIIHSWTHAAGQPAPEDNPPSYLRGWNHVEADADGNLYAIVPLKALLKLAPDSSLEWSCDVAAHHDVALGPTGDVLVLAEEPRRVTAGGRDHVILDNLITTVRADGTIGSQLSIYEILLTDAELCRVVVAEILRRAAAFRASGWPSDEPGTCPEDVRETAAILATGEHSGETRQALRRLRGLPGSPCDVLHTNTLEILDAHPTGRWHRGDVMVCMRELNIVAVIDPVGRRVRWWWGRDELSGPHQPSVLSDGRVLVFDNGVSRGSTRLLIIDPVTREVTWTWAATPPESFFCPLAGGCEELPNGNLLVTDSTAGRAFEVTMAGAIVWRLALPADLFGTKPGRVSIYRMTHVPASVVARLQSNWSAGDVLTGAVA
ncbi:arylsulfotransferase family protein [Krasilnikovia sp. MM14-A1259]|uniref:arylsulfotransferase family protein n=1 Tax=Krasilnikovia sp. MM14-A1259 TaxID=3373539 RepID=UPI00382083B2